MRALALQARPALLAAIVFVMPSVSAARETPAPTARRTPATRPAASSVPRALDAYYGLYFQGNKVGWMRLQWQPTAAGVTMRQEVHAQVSGMGAERHLEIEEVRQYAGARGQLVAVDFVQRSEGRQVTVAARPHDEHQLKLDIGAGGAHRDMFLPAAEQLSDAIALERLAHAGRVGATATSVRFDPALQKVLHMGHRVVARERRTSSGVAIDAVRIETRNEELGSVEMSWVEPTGRVLEHRLANLMTARLEPADEAKKLDFRQDVLISAMVRAPERLMTPRSLNTLVLDFEGFDDFPTPTSARQRVLRNGPRTTITVTKDPLPPRQPRGPPSLPADPEVAEALAPTAFIQSDHPAIVAAAREAAGTADDIFSAATSVCHWVYGRLAKEYAPEYSNALESLNSGRGDCTEHSVLFVALCRALGLPAREAVGIAYAAPGDGFGWHAWAEVRVGDRWVAMDPTWNQPIADATHVKLASGGPLEQSRIAMLIGSLRLVAMRGS